MSALDDWTLPPIPKEIKHLTPYFQRAQELRTRDPAMAYWCEYNLIVVTQSALIMFPLKARFTDCKLLYPSKHLL